MKNKRIMAIILSAVMAVSVCMPMSGMSAFAADIAEELNAETEVEVEDNETALEEEAVSPESDEAATEEIKEADVEEETIEEPVMEVTEERTAHEEDKELDEIIEPEQVEVVQEAKLAAEVRVAQAIWTEDNTTLTFYYGPLVSYGDTLNGASVTEVWSGTDVTDSCDGDPEWRNTVSEFLTNVVFDVSFLTVSPRSTHNWFRSCKKLTSVDMSGLNTSNVTNMSGMFYQCRSLKSLDVSGFDTSRVTDMSDMFGICYNLRKVDVSGFDTSKVTNMAGMFNSCEGLTELDVSNFDTSNVTNMCLMFGGCGLKSLDISEFNTSKVTNMSGMFSSTYIESLDVSGLDTSRVTDMRSMFNGCWNLTSLDVSGFDTSQVTDMCYMFYNCPALESLDVSKFDTSKVTIMSSMFGGSNKLTSLDVSGFDTSNVEDMSYMFDGCSSLTDIDVSRFDTSNVEDMKYMFSSCGITSIDLSGFDTASVDDTESMFYCCTNLKTIFCSNSSTAWKNIPSSDRMFEDCKSLIGKDGDAEVAYDMNKTDVSMAKAASLGGYFTPKNSTAVALGKTTRGDMFNLANNVKVTWKEVPGAKYYKVYREGITDSKESRKDPVIVTTGLVGWDKEAGLTNGHAYRYKIVASTTGKGDSSGDSSLSYSKVMYRLKTVVIRSVKNTAPGKMTVKYDKTTSGDSYVLQYSERQDMVSAKTKVVLGANKTSYTIGGLKKGKTYYISIRVRKKVNGIDYYTTFGVPKKIKITQ